MNKIDASIFNTLINHKFKVTSSEITNGASAVEPPSESLSLELVEVTETKRDTHDTISLIFHGNADFFLQQMTYKFSTDGFEPKDIFIVPVGEIKESHKLGAKRIGYKYQAIFSKLNED